MRRLIVLLSAVVCLSSAFGQSPNGLMPGGVPGRARLPIVRMAHRPLVLSTGRVLTPADKARFIASARLAFKTSVPGSSARPMAAPAPSANSGPTTQTISVAQPAGSGSFTMAAYGVGEWDPSDAGLEMNQMTPSIQSFLGFNVTAMAGNVYLLSLQVFSNCPAQFAFTTAPDGTVVGGQPAETVSVPRGTSGIGYVFDATTTGGIWIQVSSSCGWSFLSAELTTTPL